MRVEPRNSPAVRCAYCHDALGEHEPQRCPSCETPLHADCGARLETCPIYGCDQALHGIASKPATSRSDGLPILLLLGLYAVWALIALAPAPQWDLVRNDRNARPIPDSRVKQGDGDATQRVKLGNGDATQEQLLSDLRQGGASVRLRAVVALRSRGGEEAIQTLSEVLSLDRSPAVRLEAARALALVSAPQDGVAFSALESALADDRVPVVRVGCATALATRLCARSPLAVDADTVALRGTKTITKGLKDPDERVRVACMDALVLLAQRRPHPSVTDALKQASQVGSERLRAAARRALQLYTDRPR